MKFFFARDYKQKHRYFSSALLSHTQLKSSRWKNILETAKKKLMLLPQRILRQEQAFGNILKLKEKKIQVLYSGRLKEKRIKIKFYFFLQKQRTKHVFLLIGETILLPISGLAALLPGPNVFFGVLALLMITQWQALKGINRLLKKEHEFIPSLLLEEWEQAIESKKEEELSGILEKIKNEYNLDNIHKILWK